jgi:hypothetical protein
VLCDDIPEYFMYYKYPDDIAVSDFVDESLNKTFGEDLYQWWTNYCGIVDGQQVCDEDICAPCAAAAQCFSDGGGCSAFDTDTREWVGEAYSLCNSGQAIQCAACFPDCYLAYESIPICATCAEAAPCFSSDACAVLDVDTGLWDDPFGACNEGALICSQCFPACENSADADACTACAEAAPCFSSEGCAVFDVEAGLWDGAFAACNEGALACSPCFPACEGDDTPTATTSPTATPKDDPPTSPPSAGFSKFGFSALLLISIAMAAARPDHVIAEIW